MLLTLLRICKNWKKHKRWLNCVIEIKHFLQISYDKNIQIIILCVKWSNGDSCVCWSKLDKDDAYLSNSLIITLSDQAYQI